MFAHVRAHLITYAQWPSHLRSHCKPILIDDTSPPTKRPPDTQDGIQFPRGWDKFKDIVNALLAKPLENFALRADCTSTGHQVPIPKVRDVMTRRINAAGERTGRLIPRGDGTYRIFQTVSGTCCYYGTSLLHTDLSVAEWEVAIHIPGRCQGPRPARWGQVGPMGRDHMEPFRAPSRLVSGRPWGGGS